MIARLWLLDFRSERRVGGGSEERVPAPRKSRVDYYFRGTRTAVFVVHFSRICLRREGKKKKVGGEGEEEEEGIVGERKRARERDREWVLVLL